MGGERRRATADLEMADQPEVGIEVADTAVASRVQVVYLGQVLDNRGELGLKPHLNAYLTYLVELCQASIVLLTQLACMHKLVVSAETCPGWA